MTNAENAIANLKNMKYLCEADNHGRGYGIFHVNEGDKAWIDEAIKALSEPTIPLSVIEKITETMEVEYASADELADWFSDGDKTEASYYRGKANGIKLVKGIIDKAVKESNT